MAGLEINLTAADVEAMVKDAILKTAFGSIIEKKLNDVLQDGYNNPLDTAVKEFVLQLAVGLLKEKLHDRLKVLVAEEIERRMTDDILKAFLQKTVDRLIMASESRF